MLQVEIIRHCGVPGIENTGKEQRRNGEASLSRIVFQSDFRLLGGKASAIFVFPALSADLYRWGCRDEMLHEKPVEYTHGGSSPPWGRRGS